MSTKFNPGTRTRKTPAVCRKGPVGLPAVYLAGLPTSLTAFCRWEETYPAYLAAEMVRLQWHAASNSWRGASAEFGHNLECRVTKTATDHVYHVELNHRNGQVEIDHAEWDDVPIAQGPPFDSGLLQNPQHLPQPKYAIHVIN